MTKARALKRAVMPSLLLGYLVYQTVAKWRHQEEPHHLMAGSSPSHPPSPAELYQENQVWRPPPQPEAAGDVKSGFKTILYWNDFYGRHDPFGFGLGEGAFSQNGCRFDKCLALARNRTGGPWGGPSVAAFDAVVVHIRGLPNDWPQVRRKEQRYIMLTVDPPEELYEYRRLEKLAFNWTMTYRADSTFPLIQDSLRNVMPLPAPPGSPQLDRFIRSQGLKLAHRQRRGQLAPQGSSQMGLVAMIVSNCRSFSKHEAFLRQLKNLVPLDIYGLSKEYLCSPEIREILAISGGSQARSADGKVDPLPPSDGTRKEWQSGRSGRTDSSSSARTGQQHLLEEGYAGLASKYKFILVMEDAICKDFVTHKFFALFGKSKGGVNLEAVPIVLGGATNYSVIAPYRSFIDAAHFQSPETLAHQLKLLDADDAEYFTFFWWHQFYSLSSTRLHPEHHPHRHTSVICDLCQRLHTDDEERTYDNMRDWWVEQSKCRNPKWSQLK